TCALPIFAFGLFIEKQFLITFSPLYSGMGFSIIGAVLIEKLRSLYKAYQEIGIPIILSGGVGVSVIFIALANGFNTDLFGFLFGSVSDVMVNDFYLISALCIFVILAILIFFHVLLTCSYLF